jgi:hypothetical protein
MADVLLPDEAAAIAAAIRKLPATNQTLEESADAIWAALDDAGWRLEHAVPGRMTISYTVTGDLELDVIAITSGQIERLAPDVRTRVCDYLAARYTPVGWGDE